MRWQRGWGNDKKNEQRGKKEFNKGGVIYFSLADRIFGFYTLSGHRLHLLQFLLLFGAAAASIRRAA